MGTISRKGPCLHYSNTPILHHSLLAIPDYFMNNSYPASRLKRILQKRFRPVCLLLLLGIVMIIMGVVLQENQATLRNALYLCLDCIGIG